MISIICTNCQAQLSIDDAFSGGVCRCQFCGAIQTVPGKNAKPMRAASPQVKVPAGAVSAAGQKTLYTKKAQTPGSGTGLNDLAEVVASSGLSGLSGSGLTGGHNRRKPPAGAASPKNKLVPILIGSGAIIVVLVAVLIWMATRHDDRPQTEAGSVGTHEASTAVIPNFLGIKLDDRVVVFLLDRGQASRGTLAYTRLAFLKSLGTFRSDQKYQVVFWKTRLPLAVFPPAGPAEVSPAQIEACRGAIDDVEADSTSDVKPALERAMKGSPDAIVIVTGKLLDDGFVKTVLDVRKDAKVKIHCVSIDDPSLAGVMQQVASKTGGTYRNVAKSDLINATR